jgi:type I restriction enzyme S subunit
MDLPGTWRRSIFKDVCLSTIQWNPSKEKRERFTYIDVSAVSRNSCAIQQPQVVSAKEAPSRARKIVLVGDSLYATVRPTLRRIAFVDHDYDNQIASTAFCVLRPNTNEVTPRFLYFLLQTDFINDEITKHESGASYPAVNDKHVLNCEVPLPPKPEQEKIAAVLWKVQKAVEVQNKLVRTMRELKAAAMRRLFIRGLRNEPTTETSFGEVPASWDIQLLGVCCHVQTGVTKGRKLPPDQTIEVPYLRVANVQDGYLDLTEIKTIQIRRDELEDYLLREGDVVLTEGGDFDKLGRGFIWHGQVKECVHQNHIFAVRVNRDLLEPEFLAYLVQSPYGKSYFLTVAHKTTNLASINSTKLKALPVLIPPKDEQRQIAHILQTLDRKIALHVKKRAALNDLFKTLLHLLMTAQIRVHKLEIDVSEVRC